MRWFRENFPEELQKFDEELTRAAGLPYGDTMTPPGYKPPLRLPPRGEQSARSELSAVPTRSSSPTACFASPWRVLEGRCPGIHRQPEQRSHPSTEGRPTTSSGSIPTPRKWSSRPFREGYRHDQTPEPPEVAMPVMNEQVRKARAERLLQLREEGMSPAAAWRVVDSDSKATDSSAAERTRSEIRRYRERYCVVDAPGESDGLEGGEAGGPNGSALNGAAAEVAEDVAAKPAKRCAGVAGRPCGKEISGRSPRCDDCRKEHGRLRKQRNNRNDHRRHGEERKELGIKKRQEEEERHREEERRRLQDEEAKRQAAALGSRTRGRVETH